MKLNLITYREDRKDFMLAKCQIFIVVFIYLRLLIAEWELKYMEKMELDDYGINKCREALSKSLSQTLKDEKVQGIAIEDGHAFCVKSKTLVIKFALTNISCIPILDQLSEVVRKCFEKHDVKCVSVKNGKKVPR